MAKKKKKLDPGLRRDDGEARVVSPHPPAAARRAPPSPEAGEGATWRQWATRPRLRADWEARFNAWLESVDGAAHDWARHDCLVQVAGAIEAQTGRDFAEGHRGRYRSGAAAKRYLRSLGFASAAALLDDILDPVPPAFAQRGDIALVKLPGLSAVPAPIVGGEALALVHGGAPPLRVPRRLWTRAWSVGRRTTGAGE